MKIRRAGFVVLLGCLPALAAPPSPSGAPEVVRRWIDAVGGEKRIRKARSVVLRADSTAEGVTGRVEQRLEDDSWRRATVQGSRTSEAVCHGGVAWFKDWNGQVLELAGRDRRDQLAEAAIDGLVFGAGLARAASNPEIALSEPAGDGKSDVLRFAPKDGLPFDVFLDKVTALPVKAVRKPYDDVIVLEFSDWRLVKGRKVPFSVRETVEGDESESTMLVRSVVAAADAGATGFQRPASGPKDYRFDAGRTAAGIPFNFENDHLMVHGQVNGRTALWFMLDTGAEETIINKPRMAELGLTPFGASTISGGGNSTDFAFTEVGTLRIGGVELLNQRDGVIDLSGLERIYGMPMGGILGYDFFSRFVVSVNYDSKTIDLVEPEGFSDPGAGVTVPFVLEKGQPHVSSTIGVAAAPAIPADLIVDCGAADTLNLTSPFVKAHRLLELARSKPPAGPNTMAGSEREFFAQTSVRGRLATASLGTFTLRDIPSNLMVGTKGAYASRSFSGTLGEGVLHRFNTVYDYSRNAMILHPNAELDKPFPPRRTFGATFLSDGADYTHFTITGVRKDSPAEAAGLKKDDVVTAVDGKSAAEFRLSDLRKFFADDGSHHRLVLQRGGETLTIELDVKLLSLDEI